MRKALVILNPIAGARKLKITPELLRRYFSGSPIELDIHYSNYAGHAGDLVREALDHGDITEVITAGGDGSLRDIARPLIGSGIPAAIIPTGSGNGIARHAGIPCHSLSSLDIIKEGFHVAIDAGSVGDELFFSNAGIGLDAWIIHEYDQIPQRGWMSYTGLAIKNYLKYKPYELQVQYGNTVFSMPRTALLSIALSNQYGYNVKIAPRASLMDGLFDIQIMPMLSIPRALYFTGHMLGGKYYQARDIHFARSEELIVQLESSQKLQLDGEPYQADLEMHFKVLKEAWRLMVPRESV